MSGRAADVAGVVLAGGRATRLGGGDKPLRLLGGRPMLAGILERLKPQVGPIAISANGDPARFAEYGLPVLADEGRQAGPLAGILSGLVWAKAETKSRAVLTVAGDTPFFPDRPGGAAGRRSRRTPRLHRGGRVGRPPASGLCASGQSHWRLTCAISWLRARFSASPPFWTGTRQHASTFRCASAGDETLDPFFNVNTPQDLAEAAGLHARQRHMTQRVFGITGWKNSGKTTLTERLVAELTRRGWKVSTVKHAHHDFDIDKEGTDSFRHRQAGASEVAIVSGRRWALMHELRGEDEPPLDVVLARLAPCDLVLVEGYKRESHKKIETRRADAKDTAPLSRRRSLDPGDRFRFSGSG